MRVPALVVAIDSDVLYPPVEQQELAAALPRGAARDARSPHGHDAFLIEGESVEEIVRRFRSSLEKDAVPAGERQRVA